MKIFLLAIISLSLTIFYYIEKSYIGFPDGHIASYDEQRRYLLMAAVIFNLILTLLAVIRKNASFKLLALFVVINLAAIYVNFMLGSHSGRGG